MGSGPVAVPPFDRDDADLIIRSSDGVDFRVHRIILSLSSYFFADMLALPQPSGTASIPIVDVTEDSHTLDMFLRFSYPIIDPEVKSLLELRKVLTAAVKYDAAIVVHAMKKIMVSPPSLNKEPLRVYAIACIFGLEEEAQIAADHAVTTHTSVSWVEEYEELDEISAGAYYRLLKLRRRGPRTTKSGKKGNSGGTPIFNHFGIAPYCRAPTSGALPWTTCRRKLDSVSEPFNASDADVVLQTADSQEFRAHRAILHLASPTFLGMLMREDSHKREDDSKTDIPVYLMPEDTLTVDALLRFCYPVELPELRDTDTLLDVVFAARKYKFGRVERLVRTTSSARLAAQPSLQFYFAAVRLGWTEEARACALQLTQQLTREQLNELYIPEMEAISSVSYRHLLSYDQACRDAAKADLKLTNLPTRGCQSSVYGGCHLRYPTAVSTQSMPEWVRFDTIKKLTDVRPSGKTVFEDFSCLKTFLSAVCGDKPPCSEPFAKRDGVFHRSHLAQGCTAETNAEWGLSILRRFAAAVDEAVSRVELKIEEEK